jgi:hypothetical protein
VASRNGDRPYGLAALCEEDQAGPAIVRIGLPFDITQAFEFLDGLGHRLLAHMRKLGEFAHLNSVRRDEREDIRMGRPDVTETGLVKSLVDGLGPVLMNQSQEQAEGWRMHR